MGKPVVRCLCSAVVLNRSAGASGAKKGVKRAASPAASADVTKRAAADKTVDVATTAPVMPMTVNS